MKETQTKEKDLFQFDFKENLPVTTKTEREAANEEKNKKIKERIKEIENLMLPGKAPVRLSPLYQSSVDKKTGLNIQTMEDKIDLKQTILREPHSTFYDALEKITATTDLELAEEVFNRGVNAMPNQNNNRVRLCNTMIQTLADREPKDSTEAKLIMQESALFAQGMEYLKRAENCELIPQAEFYMKNAIKLLRLHNETVEVINKHRRGGEQKVTVQHQYVQVNDGGQAVIGQMGGGGKEKIAEVSPC